jgi:hypothetical protein
MMRKDRLDVIDARKTEPDEIDLFSKNSIDKEIKRIKKINFRPFYKMLTSPKKNLEKIYDLKYPIIWPLILICCSGIVSSLHKTLYRRDGDTNFFFNILIDTSGVFMLTILLCIFLTYTGRMFGGMSTVKKMIIAWGWSCTPMCYVLLIWFIKYSLVGENMFSDGALVKEHSGLTFRALNYLTVISAIFMVWQTTLMLVSISVAHNFSKTRAFFTALVLFLILTLISLTQ